MSLSGKVALVTGGGQGIGRAVVLRLQREGMLVAIAEIDPEAGAEAEAEADDPAGVIFVQTDVGDPASVQHAIARTVEKFGALDAVVNNAGIFSPRPLADLPLEEWNRTLAVNLTGPMLCARYALPHLEKTGGSIINIASTRALMSEPHSEAYAASKGGLVALTHALAISMGPRVRVNCISPGWIEVGDWKKSSEARPPEHTPEDHAQHPAGRVGKTEDVAGLVAYLLHVDASFITGANFIVDGGMTRKMIYAPSA